ncbi:UNVERIFIED_CONTAM: Ribosomal RNA large subunit methyltransferase I [Sesamum radiatum]|uniref:Ribosomal RNA large subunit methyltransferase I n=1 Tax=Sesamum radiatum TaxID=300843 RepID=A0AAW2T488_SESRA
MSRTLSFAAAPPTSPTTLQEIASTHPKGVDSSARALDIAKENIALNNLDSGVISFLRQDATYFMKNAISNGDTWDIVILDPPKLAPRKKGAASTAGRKITVIRQAGAACDHPIDPSYPEGEYLSNVLLRVL